MVVHLDGEKWTYAPPDGVARSEVRFASASAREGEPTLEVLVNDGEIDCVTLRVPHSWWPISGQPFCPELHSGDVLTLRANGKVDVRLDILEHES